MRVAAGQFAVTADWRVNARTCVALMNQAAGQGVSLLVLPEALLARDDSDPDLSVKSAQEIDGGFLQLLRDESRHHRRGQCLRVSDCENQTVACPSNGWVQHFAALAESFRCALETAFPNRATSAPCAGAAYRLARHTSGRTE
mgnify:CR=1 FL=1